MVPYHKPYSISVQEDVDQAVCQIHLSVLGMNCFYLRYPVSRLLPVCIFSTGGKLTFSSILVMLIMFRSMLATTVGVHSSVCCAFKSSFKRSSLQTILRCLPGISDLPGLAFPDITPVVALPRRWSKRSHHADRQASVACTCFSVSAACWPVGDSELAVDGCR